MKICFACFFTLLICIQLNAQTLPVARNYEAAYNIQTRSADGRPGKNYWQNTAHYTIQVNFNPLTRLVSGSEEILYVNNSPDTLKEILFKLYPNLYKKGSQRDSPIDTADLTDGVQITNFSVDGNSQKLKEAKGTNMSVQHVLLMPGQQMKFHLDFSYILNKTSHQRTGMVDDSSAFIAYFFPRITVYDDIDGWNRFPYTGHVEMYNDFCSFDVNITVPKNYIVCATGDLLNAGEVYTPAIAERIKQAEKSDGITKVIDTSDLNTGSITAQNALNTWKFKADNVTDFVFATSNHYIWYASSLVVDKKTQRRTRVDAVFNPQHKDYYDVVDYARKTVESMSYTFPAWPFPYSHETVFDGLDQMEYPMMVNDNPLEDKTDAIALTDHEIFHTMFPFYMGINETKYAWMDEGWASIGEWVISPMIDSSIVDDYGMSAYNHSADYDFDEPITTLSPGQKGENYFLNAYAKPAMAYLYLKDMLGDELFTKALHYYIEQWHGKHPMPLDFFNCMNAGSGKNLNWFWQKWFYDRGYPDLAISHVKQKGNNIAVTINMKGSKPVPIHLTVYYKDGTTQTLHESIAVWEKSNKTSINFTSNKKIEKMVLGEVHDADTDKSNNVWKLK